jgi:parallel beta-helix repeat protein
VQNNFLNEQNLAYDDGVNQWNESYPGGGNFWGNYSGGDNRSGPLQNIYGNDGFGDRSMPILGGTNLDNYPLWPNWDALEYYKPSPGPTDVVEYAMGSVKVAVIFVESDGSIDTESENWSQPRKNNVLSEIGDAYSWWEGLEVNASLSFSIEEMGSKNTGYEPITRDSSEASLWIDEIMDGMGFESGVYLQKVMAFNHWLREQYSTDWAFSIFVVDSFNDTDGRFANSASAWAVWVAGLIVMTYDNNGWGINRMNNVTAHETGHMFYATDEYIDPGERGGYLNELEVDNSGALMDINNLVLSSGSELQIGWRDIDSDGTMDILDTEPNTYLEPYSPDPTFDTSPTYTGHAVVVPYPNDNPQGWSRDISLNTISYVQVRIDNGSWVNATALDGIFDEDVEAFSFTTPPLSPGTHFIEARSVNSVNNSDPTHANDTITIITDLDPPLINETTSDIPKSGDSYNVTADVVDNLGVDSVRLEYRITSSEGYFEIFNLSMNLSSGDSYWVQPNIWSNATWFNYTIFANDTNDNWNKTLEISLNFRVHNLDSLFGFTKIQHAIDDADTINSHTIFVENGTYYENVFVDKRLTLIGENRDYTIIDGGGVGDTMNISANWVNITEFTVTNCGFGLYDSGIEIFSSSNLEITNNNVSSNNQYGIHQISSTNNSISDNEIHSNWGYSIYLESSSYTNISNNNFINGKAQGIRLDSSSNNSVFGNFFFNNSFGVDIWPSSHYNIILNNNISKSKFQGISISASSTHNTVIYNLVTESENGIYLGSASNNTIDNNDVKFSIYHGMYALSNSNYNFFTNNYVHSNGAQGIYLGSTSSYNTINNNTVSENEVGINVSSSKDNKIYHNRIINNSLQAFDESNDQNQWDNGYPSGGNFWSDYSGPDLYSGPNQDIPGDDGIGDTNYSIYSNTRDDYPLLGEIKAHLFLYEGWNLISLPFIQSDTDLISILSTISGSYDAVQVYNTTDSLDHWKHYKEGKPFGNDLVTLNEAMGFWIRITDTPGVVFEYPGIPPIANQTITLYPGWNLVGYPSLNGYNRTNALNNITFGNQVDAVWTFDSETKIWDEISEGDFFEIGKGYWIHATTLCTWEVPI